MRNKLNKLSENKLIEISLSLARPAKTKKESIDLIIQVSKDYRLNYSDLAARFDLPRN